MFFLAYIVLPILILGNLVLAGMNLYRKKMHVILVLFCLAIPPLVYFFHSNFFPEQPQTGFIVLVRYPETVMMQTVINAIVFTVLKLSSTYEKNPRRNYYRDKEAEAQPSNINDDLLDN